MSISECVGIIGGNGWLGGAIAKAVVTSGTVDVERLILSGRSGKSDVPELSSVRWTSDNNELLEDSDVLLLAVRPEQFAKVEVDASKKLVISVMAGVTAQEITKQIGAIKVVRSIPNAAADIGKSFTPWFANPAVRDGDKDIVQSLFNACGKSAEVSRESDIDYCAVMTGSGAAFPALLAEALITHAVKQGLPYNFAEHAARSVLSDASRLFADKPGATADIVQSMIEYRGITATALQQMLSNGFKEAVAAGLDAGNK